MFARGSLKLSPVPEGRLTTHWADVDGVCRACLRVGKNKEVGYGG